MGVSAGQTLTQNGTLGNSITVAADLGYTQADDATYRNSVSMAKIWKKKVKIVTKTQTGLKFSKIGKKSKKYEKNIFYIIYVGSTKRENKKEVVASLR